MSSRAYRFPPQKFVRGVNWLTQIGLEPPHKVIRTVSKPGSNPIADPKPESTVVPISTAVVQPDAQPQASQQPVRLKDIRVGNKDGRGVPITQIYAFQSDEYAIYQAGEVMVHFADDQSKEEAQRKAILPIGSARAEVNTLVQGLVYREICDRQIAYALQLALQGYIDGAKATVVAARTLVLARRAARGRFQYLKWSYGVAAILIGLLFLASWLHPFQEASSNLWLAGKAGLVGAAFSIGLAIRGRTVALDTEFWTT